MPGCVAFQRMLIHHGLTRRAGLAIVQPRGLLSSPCGPENFLEIDVSYHTILLSLVGCATGSRHELLSASNEPVIFVSSVQQLPSRTPRCFHVGRLRSTDPYRQPSRQLIHRFSRSQALERRYQVAVQNCSPCLPLHRPLRLNLKPGPVTPTRVQRELGDQVVGMNVRLAGPVPRCHRGGEQVSHSTSAILVEVLYAGSYRLSWTSRKSSR